MREFEEELPREVFVAAVVGGFDEVIVLEDELCYMHLCERDVVVVCGGVCSVLEWKSGRGNVADPRDPNSEYSSALERQKSPVIKGVERHRIKYVEIGNGRYQDSLFLLKHTVHILGYRPACYFEGILTSLR